MNPNYILWAIPFFLVTILGEMIHNFVKAGGKDFNFEDSITNLNTGIGSQAVGALVKAGLLMGYAWVADNFAFFQVEATVWSFLICLILFDYIYYWAHRWGHEWNIFWGAHIVHHQSEEYNLTVALRQSWFHNIIAFPLFLPLPFLGFDMLTFGAAAGLVTLYQYWFHTKAIKRMPKWFELVFNSPAHHRVHHAINPKYIDHNYGAVFILWDKIHGTFIDETEEPVYGITKPLRSWNPIWANFHFYSEMWEGGKRLKSIRDKLALPFKGPAYLGNLLGESTEYSSGKTIEKFRTQTPFHLKIYVALQFMLLTYFLVAYMGQFDELPLFYQLSFFFLICLSTLSISAILENRDWFYVVEIARFLMFLPVYNLCYYHNFSDWFHVALPFSLGVSVLFSTWLLIARYHGKVTPSHIQ